MKLKLDWIFNMGLQDVADSIMEMNRAIVMAQTWGHLAPKVGVHKGAMIIALTERESSGAQILSTNFPTLKASPWEYEALCKIAFEMELTHKFETGYLYKLSGEIVWGDLIPEDFDLEEWREDTESEPNETPTFDQGMLNYEFSFKRIFKYE